TALADMAEFDILDIEWHATVFTSDVDHLVGVNEQNSRLWVEKPTDKPRTGDAIDLWPTPSHPNTRPFWCQALKFCLGDQGEAGFGPGLVATFQHARVDAIGAQLRNSALAHFVPSLACNDNRPGRVEFAFPFLCLGSVAPDTAR